MNVIKIVNQFSREIGVVGCCITSMVTLGYIITDSHNWEIKKQKMDYESKIEKLNNEIEKLQIERKNIN
jgi:hypothetical protein